MVGHEALQIAVIGDASGFAARAREAGLAVLVFATGDAAARGLDGPGISRLSAWSDAFGAMEAPRVWLLDLPPGGELDRILDEASAAIEPGDAIVDASGSWWCDTLRRWRRLRHRALWLLDLAEVPAGGGTTWIVGGDPGGFAIARPVLERLVAPHPVRRVGSAGSAHFLRAVQDAVEAAVAQAQGEAVQLAEAWPGEFDCDFARALWPAAAGGIGREAWIPDDALRLEASVPLLAQAAMLRLAERLEEHRSEPPPPRCGPFVTPEDLD
jgi:6-phosphogluconate dehydrogenase